MMIVPEKIYKLQLSSTEISQSEETTLKDMDMLIGYFEKREHIMIEFEPQTFEFLIDKIIVKGSILEFHIVGSLVFTEKL